MPKTQSGWQVRAGWTLLLAGGAWAALCDSSSAQDRTGYRVDRRQETYAGDNRVSYAPAPAYSYGYNGGPYKGFYPCNGKTPYYGGACSVYGDAPIYTAPADYGHHCAAWCP